MRTQEAKDLWQRMAEDEDFCPRCIVSTSELQGEGHIVDFIIMSPVPILKIQMDNGIMENIPCFGVMEINQ